MQFLHGLVNWVADQIYNIETSGLDLIGLEKKLTFSTDEAWPPEFCLPQPATVAVRPL